MAAESLVQFGRPGPVSQPPSSNGFRTRAYASPGMRRHGRQRVQSLSLVAVAVLPAPRPRRWQPLRPFCPFQVSLEGRRRRQWESTRATRRYCVQADTAQCKGQSACTDRSAGYHSSLHVPAGPRLTVESAREHCAPCSPQYASASAPSPHGPSTTGLAILRSSALQSPSSPGYILPKLNVEGRVCLYKYPTLISCAAVTPRPVSRCPTSSPHSRPSPWCPGLDETDTAADCVFH